MKKILIDRLNNSFGGFHIHAVRCIKFSSSRVSPFSPTFFHRSESPTKIERHHNGAFFFLRKRKEESNLNSISRERRRREAEKEYLRLQLIVVNRAETSEAKRKLDFREWRWIISMRLYLAGTGCVTLLQSSVFFPFSHSFDAFIHSFLAKQSRGQPRSSRRTWSCQRSFAALRLLNFLSRILHKKTVNLCSCLMSRLQTPRDYNGKSVFECYLCHTFA